MPETSAREAEIAIEQQHVDLVYARLAEVRAETEALRDRGHELAHGAGKEAIYEQAQMLLERDVMVQHANKMLQSLDAEHEGLVFGRLDLGSDKGRGETLYIGRLGLRDANFDNLVLDWRAPASAAFYQATAEEPMDVLRRRVIRCSQEKVLDIDDDVLTPDALTEDITVIGEGALMAALGRARGDTMRDIVATIQREQDEAIRAPAGGRDPDHRRSGHRQDRGRPAPRRLPALPQPPPDDRRGRAGHRPVAGVHQLHLAGAPLDG